MVLWKQRFFVTCALFSWVSLIYSAFVATIIPVVGLALILYFLRMAWPTDWQKRAGLEFNGKTLLLALAATGVFLGIFRFYYAQVAARSEVTIDLVAILPHVLPGMIFTLVQTCAEEIILGSLLLRFVQDRCLSLSETWATVIVAVVFGLMHVVFYQSGLILPRESLHPMSLVGLILAGILRNLLIVRFGHIAYAWALHFSWNLYMFHSPMLRSGVALGEAAKFNLLFGTWEFICLAGLAIAAVCLGCALVKTRKAI
ncbi:MAG TPA: CPBP family glutamic-type intramembrane protease [Oligoflexus sp.]|uniref:CPBP family glutamic-type intramembrane protease n=1 Tax=Oligoflexus sp. TaxID=1971216 RepID=UPI002D25F82A|nr:CPBP family glutamic-type intramembrane protease [Oligoflexus sp.]HYX38612.1 CPBP family glutamic-type intramembrane protease [Oligoflexus sp.]